ncbi:MAG: AI-2E family transporter [Ruminococcus sp.]|nr:AI-2E family transporter [Ruminococcus sp.]
MKHFKDLIHQRWFANTLAGCITVAVYLLLSHLNIVLGGISQFIGYFSIVIVGAVFAYLMNPLAKLYENKLFSKIKQIKKDSTKWSLSVGLAVTTVLLFLILILVILIPQLLASITNFVSNLGSYASSLLKQLNEFGLSFSDSPNATSIQNLLSSSENIINTIVDYISDNSSKIISASTSAGKSVVDWIISFIISVYLLTAKDRIKTGSKQFMSATMKKDVYDSTLTFLTRCNEILNRYIIFDLIDGLIVGATNAVFMAIFGMQYVGLVSVVVGVTNLVPTFGPLVGGVIGTFILLMVKPFHAVIFIIFTLILQTLDGYVIKPKLFGNTFGVSGLLILLAIVIGGKIFGILGILLAIPVVAIGDYVYREIAIPHMEKKRREQGKKERRKPETPEEEKDELMDAAEMTEIIDK